MQKKGAPPYKALRESAGLSQREVERRAGWKAGKLSWIERGVLPSDDEHDALMRVLYEAIRPKDGAA